MINYKNDQSNTEKRKERCTTLEGKKSNSLKKCEGPFCLRLICLFLKEKWVMGLGVGV